MHTSIAVFTVAFLAIWAKDLGKHEGAGKWYDAPVLMISR
jgi:hypothetical protein